MASQLRIGNTEKIMRSYWLQQALSGEGEDDTAPLTGSLSVVAVHERGATLDLWNDTTHLEPQP